MILIFSEFISFFFQVEGVIILGNSVSESWWYFRLIFGPTRDEGINLIEQFKGDVVGVDRVVSVEEV